MERKDFLLMMVAAGAMPVTPVQLQKCLFLLGENLQEEIPNPFYAFEPYHYGPFDAEVYSDADHLENQGLLVSVASKGTWLDRGITPAGMERAKAAEKELSNAGRTYIQVVVDWAQSLSFSTLVKAIYAEYPKYRTNSVFQD